MTEFESWNTKSGNLEISNLLIYRKMSVSTIKKEIKLTKGTHHFVSSAIFLVLYCIVLFGQFNLVLHCEIKFHSFAHLANLSISVNLGFRRTPLAENKPSLSIKRGYR